MNNGKSEPVEIAETGELHMVGIPVTALFQHQGPNPAIEAAKQQFLARKHEIAGQLHPDRYVCPHFASEVMFTYWFCMEVEELRDIPDGMLGFTIPAHRYVKGRSAQDPYELLHGYLREHGLRNHPKALAMEIYRFDNPQWPAEVDVYIPIAEEVQHVIGG